MVSVLASRTDDCGFEPWSNTSSVVLQVWLACSHREQNTSSIVGSCSPWSNTSSVVLQVWLACSHREQKIVLEPWSNTSSVVLQVWLACSQREQKIVFEPWSNTSSVVLQVVSVLASWNRRLWVRAMVQHIIGGVTGMVSVLASRTEDCGFEPWSNTSSVVLQVWLAWSGGAYRYGYTSSVVLQVWLALASRTEDCGFEPWSNTSSVVLQVWLACSHREQKIVGSSHGPTHHRWCYRYG